MVDTKQQQQTGTHDSENKSMISEVDKKKKKTGAESNETKTRKKGKWSCKQVQTVMKTTPPKKNGVVNRCKV